MQSCRHGLGRCESEGVFRSSCECAISGAERNAEDPRAGTQGEMMCRKRVETLSISLKCLFQQLHFVEIDAVVVVKSTFWRHRHRFDIVTTGRFSLGYDVSLPGTPLNRHKGRHTPTNFFGTTHRPEDFHADDDSLRLSMMSVRSRSRGRTWRAQTSARGGELNAFLQRHIFRA